MSPLGNLDNDRNAVAHSDSFSAALRTVAASPPTSIVTVPMPPADVVIHSDKPLPSPQVVVSAAAMVEISRLYLAMDAAPPITDQRSMDTVREIMVQAQAIKVQLEAQRELAKAPFLDMGRKIDGAAKEVRSRLDVLISAIKEDMGAFLAEQARQQEEARRIQEAAIAKARAEAEAKARAENKPVQHAVAPIVTTQVLARPVVAATYTRREVTIVDPSKLPDAYWVIDEVAVKRDALAGKLGEKEGVQIKTIPGVVAR